jgi:hypothetical protein
VSLQRSLLLKDGRYGGREIVVVSALASPLGWYCRVSLRVVGDSERHFASAWLAGFSTRRDRISHCLRREHWPQGALLSAPPSFRRIVSSWSAAATAVVVRIGCRLRLVLA